MRIDFMSRFRSNEDGAVAVIVALMLVMLMGFVALGVDTASLFRERHKLQTVADLAALSAVPDPESAAARVTTSKTRNNAASVQTTEIVKGRYLRNPAIPREARFTPLPDGAAGINAVALRLQRDAPLSFAQILTEDDHVTLERAAMAARTGAVSFSLDSAIAQLDGAALNALLSGAFSASVDISLADQNLLAAMTLSAGDLFQALASQTGFNGTNPADILTQPVTASQVLAALQNVGGGPGAAVLAGLSSRDEAPFQVSDIVGGIDTDLGLTVVDFLNGLEVSVLDVLTGVASQTVAGQSLDLALDAEVTGLLSQEASLVAGEPPARSSWVAMGEEGVVLHRAAVRVALETEAEPTILGPLLNGVTATRVHLPIYLEVAGATARLDRMSCSEDRSKAAAVFSTAPTPLNPATGTSIAALHVGTLPGLGTSAAVGIDPAEIGFADILDLDITIPLPLLPDITVGPITVQMRSAVQIGQSSTQELIFTRGDIEDGRRTQSFGSEDVLTSSVNSLLSPERTEIRIKPGQTSVLTGVSASLVNTLLSILPERLATGLAGPVDGVVNAALQAMGSDLGVGNLTVEALHCERAQLVQ